jgi:hypothetical protein
LIYDEQLEEMIEQAREQLEGEEEFVYDRQLEEEIVQAREQQGEEEEVKDQYVK